ncbi:hypothetical protein UlMin_035656 [Ulmus minor]
MMNNNLLVDDNMSNLTFASGEISATSSSTRYESGNLYPQQQSSTSTNQEPPSKKKRSLPGNPDPDAEVIALSPKSLLAKNRFICEICNKGFQRDQNLQLHRRGHNLPWKLKQRAKNEVIRKKVYVCPEVSCVHHDPSRALGDLTGIKKHFSRKHGEKKWKCEKCSKRYAVQSDWKAHSKICGTREYRCDCGTLFSRRDSFITHRAFCDALAQESTTRAIPSINPSLLPSQPPQLDFTNAYGFHQPLSSSVKREQQQQHEVPPWLMSCPPPQPQQVGPSATPPPPPPPANLSSLPFYQSNPYTSATALLQKAAQMGATISNPSPFLKPQFGNEAPSSLVHDMMSSLSSASGFAAGSSFGDESSGNFVEVVPSNATSSATHLRSRLVGGSAGAGAGAGGGGGSEGLTRDFLGLRGFPERDFFDMVGLEEMNSSAYGSSSGDLHQNKHNQTPWQG